MKYPRVLLISDATWSDDNNIGNTFSNLFGGWDSEALTMIYARGDLPSSDKCNKYFQIAESRLIKNLFNRSVKTGIEVTQDKEQDMLKQDEESGRKLYSFFKRYRLNIFLTAREILWKLGKWRTSELDDFIDSFNPQVVFVLASEGLYMNSIQRYVIERSGAPGAIYFVDDIYSIKASSFSPIFWFNKYLARRSIRRTVSMCKSVYTIIDKQKEEYDRELNVETSVLNKGGVFRESFREHIERYDIESIRYPLKLVYTGNIFAGRWETLADIGRVLDQINSNKEVPVGELYIYSKNTLEKKTRVEFDSIDSLNFMGAIPAEEVRPIQEDADILVHVESFKLKDKLDTKLSFSTKLVDYFERAKCILAIGWSEAASIDYLRVHNAAFVIDETDNLEKRLAELIGNKDMVVEYGRNAWKCGAKNHDIETIRSRLYRDMLEISDTQN